MEVNRIDCLGNGYTICDTFTYYVVDEGGRRGWPKGGQDTMPSTDRSCPHFRRQLVPFYLPCNDNNINTIPLCLPKELRMIIVILFHPCALDEGELD